MINDTRYVIVYDKFTLPVVMFRMDAQNRVQFISYNVNINRKYIFEFCSSKIEDSAKVYDVVFPLLNIMMNVMKL